MECLRANGELETGGVDKGNPLMWLGWDFNLSPAQSLFVHLVTEKINYS